MEEPTTHGHSIPLAETVKELATYEHPGDCVEIPVPVRDRIMARLNKAEGDLIEAHNRIDEIRPMLEAARDQENAASDLMRLVETGANRLLIEGARIVYARTCAELVNCIRACDAARAIKGRQ